MSRLDTSLWKPRRAGNVGLGGPRSEQRSAPTAGRAQPTCHSTWRSTTSSPTFRATCPLNPSPQSWGGSSRGVGDDSAGRRLRWPHDAVPDGRGGRGQGASMRGLHLRQARCRSSNRSLPASDSTGRASAPRRETSATGLTVWMLSSRRGGSQLTSSSSTASHPCVGCTSCRTTSRTSTGTAQSTSLLP